MIVSLSKLIGLSARQCSRRVLCCPRASAIAGVGGGHQHLHGPAGPRQAWAEQMIGDVTMTVESPEREVRPAGVDRLPALAPVFGRAFVDEPMMRWPAGSPEGAAECFTRCFSYFLELALDLELVWEAGVAMGAAVWIPPGRFESWAGHPWNQERILALTDDGGHRYDAFWRWVDSLSPTDPLWQLDSIAVEPDAQGQGYGSLLIRHGLARARTDGVGAFLSTGTQRNVRIYERCGFHVTENAEAPGGGPRIWFMRWDP
jgi:GNAT superfamily N-acetyltransferase